MRLRIKIVALIAVPLMGMAWAISHTRGQASRVRGIEGAFTYACGYIGGQRAIMSRLPALFTERDLPVGPPGCVEIAASAARNGFDQR